MFFFYLISCISVYFSFGLMGAKIAKISFRELKFTKNPWDGGGMRLMQNQSKHCGLRVKNYFFWTFLLLIWFSCVFLHAHLKTEGVSRLGSPRCGSEPCAFIRLPVTASSFSSSFAFLRSLHQDNKPSASNRHFRFLPEAPIRRHIFEACCKCMSG